MKKDLLTSKELSDRWQIHVKSLARWRVEKKGPPYIKPGGTKTSTVYYRIQDIKKWESKNLHLR